MKSEIITSFCPIINKNSKVLILGSMPGGESLKKNEYYGFKRNQFWKLIFDIFNDSYILDDVDYEKKKKVILDNNLALFDVLKSCKRKGSLDSNIKNEEINDFKKLLSEYKNIKSICFNGNKSYDSFIKNVDKNIYEGKDLIRLPSTSPAYTISYGEKFSKWKVLSSL